MPMAVKFALQFDPANIKSLAADYDYPDNAAVLETGKRIKDGEYSAAHLQTISEWKSPRSSGRVRTNAVGDVEDALRLAVAATTDRSAIAVLIGLRGVDVPVASAVLSAIYPDRFTIIDFRALASLGVKRPSPSVEFYLEYLALCRDLAATHGVSLRWIKRCGNGRVPRRDEQAPYSCPMADASREGDVRLFARCDSGLGALTDLVNNAGVLETQMRVEDRDVARLNRILVVPPSSRLGGDLVTSRA